MPPGQTRNHSLQISKPHLQTLRNRGHCDVATTRILNSCFPLLLKYTGEDETYALSPDFLERFGGGLPLEVRV